MRSGGTHGDPNTSAVSFRSRINRLNEHPGSLDIKHNGQAMLKDKDYIKTKGVDNCAHTVIKTDL